jgi:hypothetical protein
VRAQYFSVQRCRLQIDFCDPLIAISDDPADQPKSARAMRFFLHGGRVHMLYKEHENAENWMPDFPGIDVLVGTGPSWTSTPAIAAPEEWPKSEVEIFI